MPAYLSGLLLGLAMILPIGMQNLFLLNQGMMVGFPGVLVAVAAAGGCDTLLISLGATGASALLAAASGLRTAMILIGVLFLLVLGLISLRSRPENVEVTSLRRPSAVLLQTMGVSLLNPHAILDTVGVIGGAVAAHPAGERLPFTLGAVSASWLWFLALGTTGAVVQTYLTPALRLGIQRASGILMLLFATVLALQLR